MSAEQPNPVDAAISDEESRTAMRGFLQRCEVRLSTIHRVGQALLGGSALVLLLPLFVRDGFPKMTTLLISSYDADQSWIVICGIGAAAAVSVVLPVVAIYLLVGDLLGFYFTSNTFGASGAGDRAGRALEQFRARGHRPPDLGIGQGIPGTLEYIPCHLGLKPDRGQQRMLKLIKLIKHGVFFPSAYSTIIRYIVFFSLKIGKNGLLHKFCQDSFTALR